MGVGVVCARRAAPRPISVCAVSAPSLLRPAILPLIAGLGGVLPPCAPLWEGCVVFGRVWLRCVCGVLARQNPHVAVRGFWCAYGCRIRRRLRLPNTPPTTVQRVRIRSARVRGVRRRLAGMARHLACRSRHRSLPVWLVRRAVGTSILP